MPWAARKTAMLKIYADLITDELNVKKVRLLDTAGRRLDLRSSRCLSSWGRNMATNFPDWRRPLMRWIPTVTAGFPGRAAGQGFVGWAGIQHPAWRSGNARGCQSRFCCGGGGAYLAALVTDLTPELVREGLAREFVPHVPGTCAKPPTWTWPTVLRSMW